MTHTKHTELFEKLLVSFCQEADPMKEMLQWMTNQLMEVEVNNLKTNAEKGEHTPNRTTYRNGYRVRRWDTRIGTIYLTIPKVREGGYQPFFLVNRERSESAAQKINDIWPNVQGWWTQADIQKIRADYCQHYALTDKKWFKEWIRFIWHFRG